MVFADRRFTAAVAALAWMFFALFGSLFLLSLYLQTQLQYTPAQAGLRLLPLAAALGAGAGASLLIAPHTLTVRRPSGHRRAGTG
ncbi:MAG TPA: hypothetical protein VLG91_07295 [Streptomyces sp.]|nr:hypothetical protein [Streptomyces sp.]